MADGYMIECFIAVFLALFFGIIFFVQFYQHKKERQNNPTPDIHEHIIFWQRVDLLCITVSSFVFAFYAYEPLVVSNLNAMLFCLFLHVYIVSVVLYLVVTMYVSMSSTQFVKGDWRNKLDCVPLTVRVLLGMDIGLIGLICVVQTVTQVWFSESTFTFVFFPLSISLFSLLLILACIYFYLLFRSTLFHIAQPFSHLTGVSVFSGPGHASVISPSRVATPIAPPPPPPPPPVSSNTTMPKPSNGGTQGVQPSPSRPSESVITVIDKTTSDSTSFSSSSCPPTSVNQPNAAVENGNNTNQGKQMFFLFSSHA